MSYIINTNKHISIKEHMNEDRGGKLVHSLYLNAAEIKIEYAVRFEGTKEKICADITNLQVDWNERKRLRQIISRNCVDGNYFFYYEQESRFFYIIREIPESKDSQLELIFKKDDKPRTKIEKFTTRRIQEKSYVNKAGVFRSYVMERDAVYEGKFRESGIDEVAINLNNTVSHCKKNDIDLNALKPILTSKINLVNGYVPFELTPKTRVIAVGDDVKGVVVNKEHWLDFKKTFINTESDSYVSPKAWVKKHTELASKLIAEDSVWIINDDAPAEGYELSDTPKDKKAKQLYAIWL